MELIGETWRIKKVRIKIAASTE